jgi:RAB protein geranylgeranyltransferase component A
LIDNQVPLSKEDVFLNKSVGVVDKRKLMKFLTFCLDYENNPQEYIGFLLF